MHALPSELYAAGRLRGRRAGRQGQPLALCCEPEDPLLAQQTFLQHPSAKHRQSAGNMARSHDTLISCAGGDYSGEGPPRVREGSLSSAG